MKTNDTSIKIKAVARHHGLFITLIGFIALSIVIWFSTHYWYQARFVLMFLVLTCLVSIFIGLLKQAEPKHSLILTPDTLTFHHRHGRWKLNWQQIQNIHSVINTVGIEQQELNYVGIKLRSIDAIASNISLRLANRMIHEQKPLIQYCIQQRIIAVEQGVLNFEPYKLASGEVIKGPLAGFLHHSDILHQALGAHLFISASNLNSSIEDFVILANHYLRGAKQAHDSAPKENI